MPLLQYLGSLPRQCQAPQGSRCWDWPTAPSSVSGRGDGWSCAEWCKRRACAPGFGFGACGNRQEKLTQLVAGGFGSSALKVLGGAADGPGYSTWSFGGTALWQWPHGLRRNHCWATLLPCELCSQSWGGQLISQHVSVRPQAANSKKWPLIKSQTWMFPNWKRSVSDLNFPAYAASYKRVLVSPVGLQRPSSA